MDAVWPEGVQLLGAVAKPVITTREVLLQAGRSSCPTPMGRPTPRAGDESLGEAGRLDFLCSRTRYPAESLVAEVVELIGGFQPAPSDDVTPLAFTARND